LEEKIRLCMSFAEEVVQEDELRGLLEAVPNPVAYDGFEPSGRMHIAQGLFKASIVNKMTKCGFTYLFWVADWFAFLNHKMGGDLDKIKVVGQYFIEVWKAAGMDMSRVKFLWASEEILRRTNEYWLMFMDIATRFSIERTTRCCQIMGRKEEGNLSSSQIIYPCMQCADIFFLGVDVCQLGLDQRKVNMLAREYSTSTKRFKPIILSHPMLAGLKEGQEKMSKSDPDSAIFMEDSTSEVQRKIKKAFCPPNQLSPNPCIDYIKHIVFNYVEEFVIRRTAENGGDVSFKTFEEFSQAYSTGQLHPGDVKAALAIELNKLIEPVRKHFETNKEAASILKRVQQYQKQAAAAAAKAKKDE